LEPRKFFAKKGVAYEPVCNFGQVRRLRLVPAPESAKNIYRRDVFRSAELEYVSSLFPQRARPAISQDRGPQGFGHRKSDQEKIQNANENAPISPARISLSVNGRRQIMEQPELLDEKAISQRGKFRRVRRWLRGMHPDKGVITKGWTGWETVQETERLPIRTFNVARSKSDPG
jgi:hypothetical protein